MYSVLRMNDDEWLHSKGWAFHGAQGHHWKKIGSCELALRLVGPDYEITTIAFTQSGKRLVLLYQSLFDGGTIRESLCSNVESITAVHAVIENIA